MACPGGNKYKAALGGISAAIEAICEQTGLDCEILLVLKSKSCDCFVANCPGGNAVAAELAGRVAELAAKGQS